MFWRKKKPPQNTSSILQMATKMGIERRRFVRVKYPELEESYSALPEIGFETSLFRVMDISVGGCCLFDPKELLGAQIGQDIELNFIWTGKIDKVKSRICGRVDHRRHIQFMDLSNERVEQLKKSMLPGVRGQAMKVVAHYDNGPVLEADEVWNSPHGDAVTFENHVHRYAQIFMLNTSYSIFREAWPVKDNNKPSTPKDLEQLLMFLSNIPMPSLRLKGLITTLHQMLAGLEPS